MFCGTQLPAADWRLLGKLEARKHTVTEAGHCESSGTTSGVLCCRGPTMPNGGVLSLLGAGTGPLIGGPTLSRAFPPAPQSTFALSR